MTPATGWLAGRFGRKTIFLISIATFTAASALCGAAQNLTEIVLFRVLQGAFGAALIPLSQGVVLDVYTIEERGPFMAIWGMGVMTAPIVGPVLGGWLTDDFSWRWVFYINLPIGLLCLLGVMRSMPNDKVVQPRRLDISGFALLSIALASAQMFLDRGQNNDWFHSTETIVEALIASVALILFIVHSSLVDRPFIPPELLADRNFVTAALISFTIGLLMFAVLALLPPMLETLFGYPVITTGLITAPRGIGSLISTYIAGRMVGRIDTRLLMFTGLALFATAFAMMQAISPSPWARRC